MTHLLHASVAAIVALPLLSSPAAHANESHCYSIKDSDKKNYCLALAKHQASHCYSVRNSDKKNLCLSQIKGQQSYCYSIRSSDDRHLCLAVAK